MLGLVACSSSEASSASSGAGGGSSGTGAGGGSTGSGGGACCSPACGCATHPTPVNGACVFLHTVSEGCAYARSDDMPGSPNAERASRAEGCGYVSYAFGNGFGGWALHYDLATGELVGLEVYSDIQLDEPCADAHQDGHASYGMVPDWASCPQKIVCGPTFGGQASICDWAALCGP